MKTAILIVAAGRGTRAGGGIPKQYRPLNGKPVLQRTLKAFQGIAEEYVVVLHPADQAQWAEIARALPQLSVKTTLGGATRAASVSAGLTALSPEITHVLIHDAARPLIRQSTVRDVLSKLQTHKAAAPALTVTDALWRGEHGLVTGTADRAGLYRAQTPQGFHVETIRAAYREADLAAADDVEVARLSGVDVAICEGDEENIKITRPEDFARAEEILATRHKERDVDIRVGNGFDVHRFGLGYHVILCGVKIPHTRALQGHSDADVGLHTITDAIYGALAEGDIGQHFPPSDPKWKGADSTIFLKHAVSRATERGFMISNVDCTLICEMPKIGPHAGAMRDCLASLMALDADRVSVKATTSERLGFTGREEGIACLATVTLVQP